MSKLGKENKKFTGYEEISGRFWSRIKASALKRNYKFEIDIKEAWDLYVSQNKKCAISGLDLTLTNNRKIETTASIDRKNNTLGYILTNIQWVHKSINYMKHTLHQDDLITFCEKIYLSNIKNQNWERYFLSLAKIIATRSKDPSTQHGCVITNEKFRIISCGYNGPIQGIDDSLIPLTRPEKYDYFLHSEENALLFAKQDLTNCYAFITGMPCSKCARMLIQAGITKIYYGDLLAKVCTNSDTEIVKFFCKEKNVELIPITYK